MPARDVAAFQPGVSDIISGLQRVEYSCQGEMLRLSNQGCLTISVVCSELGILAAFQHRCLTLSAVCRELSILARERCCCFPAQVSDIISSLGRVEYSCQGEGRDQIRRRVCAGFQPGGAMSHIL